MLHKQKQIKLCKMHNDCPLIHNNRSGNDDENKKQESPIGLSCDLQSVDFVYVFN